MNRASAGMRSLCEEVRGSSVDRKEFIKQLKGQTGTIRSNARRFLIDSKKFRKEMGKELREDLQGSKRELIKTVSGLREDFKKKNRELRTDLAEASKIWREMSHSLKRKKINLKRETEVTRDG